MHFIENSRTETHMQSKVEAKLRPSPERMKELSFGMGGVVNASLNATVTVWGCTLQNRGYDYYEDRGGKIIVLLS